MNFELGDPETETHDYYRVNVVVPKIGGHKAAEVTGVGVRVCAMDEDDGYRYVQVDLFGYPLTAKGQRSKSAGRNGIYGARDCEVRWSLARAALWASLVHHNIDPTEIPTHNLQTWAEHAEDCAEYHRSIARGILAESGHA